MARPHLQLEPEHPFWHVPTSQLCYAFVLIDYTQDHDLIFACKMSSGEIVCVQNKDLRAVENLTLMRGRFAAVSAFARPADGADSARDLRVPT